MNALTTQENLALTEVPTIEQQIDRYVALDRSIKSLTAELNEMKAHFKETLKCGSPGIKYSGQTYSILMIEKLVSGKVDYDAIIADYNIPQSVIAQKYTADCKIQKDVRVTV